MNKIAALTSKDLADLGASKANIRWLTKPSAESIQYLDLIEPRNIRRRKWPAARPSAVIEFEGQPLLYVVGNRGLAKDFTAGRDEIAKTLRLLACRGDPAYLAVMDYGQVIIYPIGLNKDEVPNGVPWNMSLMGHRSLVQDLVAEAVPGLPGRGVRRVAVHDLLFRLLSHATDQLLEIPTLRERHDDVLALVGRALFARFLIDRNIMTDRTFSALGNMPEECFATPKMAAMTCKWLDDKFNGELLPLASGAYQAYFESLGNGADTVFRILSNILYRAPGGQLSFDSEWGDLDFAHLPIGLLSEVYERYAHRHIGKNAVRASMHYTPRHIAEFMIEEAFEGLNPRHRHRAHLLDPAAGGGVFLTLGFRKLVAELWNDKRRRPSRQEIRQILYEQIRGFDINPSALKLAALGLYLTAIELDPDLNDFDEFSFRPLFAFSKDADLTTVLTCARLASESESNPDVMGSLGSAISPDHRKRYEIVIGNPPWSGLSSKKGAKSIVGKFPDIVREIAGARAEENNQHPGLLMISKSYDNPDGVPDLPFVWRSMEWATDGGVIALALHARLLFKQADMGAKARDAVFAGLRVTGVLNGAAVRKERVWPNVDAPWCLLFARNEVPEDHHLFHFVSVELETPLNARGRVRIDHKNAQPIQFSVLRDKPYLLKTMFRGTAMDATVMEHLASVPTLRLSEYMTSHGLASGEGYQVYEDGDSNDSSHMIGMLDLKREWAPRFSVDRKSVTQLFERRTLHRTRNRAIYRGPLIIIPESLPESPDQGCGLIAIEDVAYTESFTGYSTVGFKGGDPEALARYLHTLTYSKLFQYYLLMTSAKFGIERDTIQKEDIDDFPIIPFEQLDCKTVTNIKEISTAIAEEKLPWREVDELAFRIYGIPDKLQRIIADTLSVSLPYTITNERAEAPPSKAEIEVFRSALEDHLRPLFENAGVTLSVEARPVTDGSWVFLDVCSEGHRPRNWDQAWLKQMADAQGASSIIVPNPPHHLGIGILAQYRYWTASRAHLCALTVVREYSNGLIEAGVKVA